jgi:hypothetical protein
MGHLNFGMRGIALLLVVGFGLILALAIAVDLRRAVFLPASLLMLGYTSTDCTLWTAIVSFIAAIAGLPFGVALVWKADLLAHRDRIETLARDDAR